MNPYKIFIGFDIYGAGNVGDDLTIGGFLYVFPGDLKFKISCILPKQRIKSQENRFPEIDWLPLGNTDSQRKKNIIDNKYWLGVGDTPFQARAGKWFLDKIYSDIRLTKQKKYMIGVGCEEEVLKEKNLATKITQNMDYIWTRDAASQRILVDHLGGNSRKIGIGGDLANIALQRIFPPSISKNNPRYSLGLLYYSEFLNKDNLIALRKFINKFMQNDSVAFIGNETRKLAKYEYFIYKLLFWDSMVRFREPPDYYMPNYKNNSLGGLVSHFKNYSVVMASRYHAILAAAWAGCSLVALDRSSKIRFLSEELGIPLIKEPFTENSLWEGYKKAKPVSRDLLVKIAKRAEASVLDLYNLISPN